MARQYDWWDKTWNPVGGCKPVSDGCKNCYAAKQAATLHQEATASRQVVPLYDGTVKRVKGGRYVFNGRLTAFKPKHRGWTWPLRWPGAQIPLLGPGEPSLIFVGDMTDVFYDSRPKSLIDRTLGTIALSEHIGMLLTKRPDRMAEYFAAAQLQSSALSRWQRHLWLGFSAERQKEFDLRWEPVRALAARGWTVFVSIAPMLAPVTLPPDFLALGARGWAIVSGEQGPHDRCRDMDPDWARAVRDQCADARVPFFCKQMARRAPIPLDLFVRQFPAVRLADKLDVTHRTPSASDAA
jgi:protein gp37